MDPAITDAWHHPIEASVFSVPEPQPQVVVHVNGVRAMCGADAGCSYNPTATDVAVVTGVDIVDSEVTISGSGFGSQVGGQLRIPPVSIGSVLCLTENGAWTDSEIQCTLETKTLPGSSMVKVCGCSEFSRTYGPYIVPIVSCHCINVILQLETDPVS